MSWCGGPGTGGWLMLGAMVLVLLVALWAVSRIFPSAPRDALGVLDTRLARGEVDLVTYWRLRDELAGPAGATRGDTP